MLEGQQQIQQMLLFELLGLQLSTSVLSNPGETMHLKLVGNSFMQFMQLCYVHSGSLL